MSREEKLEQGCLLLRLGADCYMRGDLDDALRQWRKASEVFGEIGEQGGLAASLGNQAVILKDRGDLDGAMKLHKQEEQIFRELGDKAGLARSLGNQAVILKDRGDLDAAMKLHKQEEQIFCELEDVKGLAISLANQAYLLGLSMGRLREAVVLAERAYRLASGHGLVALAGQLKGILDEIRQATDR